jgi:hypothetical protein
VLLGKLSNPTVKTRIQNLDLLSVSGFASFININTRFPIGRKHACLDHIFININEHIIKLVNSGVCKRI